MTKARDLAGFASSTSTTTASDGLVLKGDGSTTDVIIKNGANATVASVADGTINIAAAGSITAAGASVGALARGSIQVGNSSGVAAPLAKGAAGTFLTSNGTDLSYAAVATGFQTVVFPSNWASPTATYTSSGTYSKGGLSDDAYVWVYLVGGGGGGARQYNNENTFSGSRGGRAMLIYAKAGVLDGASYVVGAGAAGQTSNGGSETPPTASSFTLTNANGGNVFTTSVDTGRSSADVNLNPFIKTVLTASSDATSILTATETESIQFSGTLPSGFESFFQGQGGDDVVFGAAGGAGKHFSGAIGATGYAAGTSTYAGNGAAATSGATGVAPGGGGTIGVNANGGAGAAGSVRVYNV